MSKAVLDIKPWCNSPGVCLPDTVARAAHLHLDQRVHVSIESDPSSRRLLIRSLPWVPDRQDIIWIDFNPQVGREMHDVHPFAGHSTNLGFPDPGRARRNFREMKLA